MLAAISSKKMLK